jgi:hypothetical protein
MKFHQQLSAHILKFCAFKDETYVGHHHYASLLLIWTHMESTMKYGRKSEAISRMLECLCLPVDTQAARSAAMLIPL